MKNATFARAEFDSITQHVNDVVKQRYKFVYKLSYDIPDKYVASVMDEMLTNEERGDFPKTSWRVIVEPFPDYEQRLKTAQSLYTLYKPV